MNKLERIIRKLRISTLQYFHIFGDGRYKTRVVKVCSKYNVHFDGRPGFIAPDARLDNNVAIFVGAGSIVAKDILSNEVWVGNPTRRIGAI